MSLLDALRGWNRRRIAARRLTRTPRPTPFGFVMNGTDDMVAGRFEPEETALLRGLLARTDRFVNVGANTGYYCLFARAAGVPVLALEPVPQTVQVLMQNLRANGFDTGVTVLPVAAGEAPGTAVIYGVGTGSSLLKGWANNPESLAQTVPVVRLDDVVRPPAPAERVLVLMDVEGFEYPALQGSRQLIAADPKPVWMIEIAPDGAGTAISDHVQATFDLMAAAGYAARRADGGLGLVTGPVKGVTNYIFHDAALPAEAVFGP
jgi:FkbM family methyltransferase